LKAPIKRRQQAIDHRAVRAACAHARWPEDRHEGGEQEDLDVATEDRLGERRPDDREWPGPGRQSQPAARQQAPDEQHRDPSDVDDRPGQREERRHRRQDDRRVQERQLLPVAVEGCRVVDQLPGQPPLGGP
jgi:hypothetical protein